MNVTTYEAYLHCKLREYVKFNDTEYMDFKINNLL